ncbi:hypothetical protein Tco_1534808, partial [Tanacetum coccineum]
GVFNRLGSKEKSVSAHLESRYQSSRSRKVESIHRKRYHERTYSRRTKLLSESEDSGGGHCKLRSKKQKSSVEEDDMSQPWVCEETNPFTPRIRYSDFPKKNRMPNNVKTYEENDDLEDHLKIFQAAVKVERWAMPRWCHMVNSTLTGSSRVWFDDLPSKSVDSCDDLEKAFLANFLKQKKHVKGALECMRISGFMHGITNPKLIKRLHDNISESIDEMIRATTAYLRGDVAASNHVRKKNQQRSKRRRDKFTLLTKSSKEILALDKGKFKTPPPMTTPVEKRNSNKFCEFQGEVGHNTDECMHLRRQIEELIKARKLSHVIKEQKQSSGKDQPKAAKKGESSERIILWQS